MVIRTVLCSRSAVENHSASLPHAVKSCAGRNQFTMFCFALL